MNEGNGNRKYSCSSPENHNSEALHEHQFSTNYPALPVPVPTNRQHQHLILNNFLTTTDVSDKKSLSTGHQVDNHRSGSNSIPKEIDLNSHPQHKAHANFLFVYFRFSYFLCLTPFRLKKVDRFGENRDTFFEIYECRVQKILCGVANVLVLLAYAIEFRKCVQDVRRDNPISFFKLFEASSSLAVKGVILKCFWRNKREFLRVVRFLNNPYILAYNQFKFQSIAAVTSLCTLYLFVGFTRMITGPDFIRPSSLNPSWWSRRLIAEARYSFFITNGSHIDHAPPWEDINSLDWCLAGFTAVMFQCRFLAGFFVDLAILLCVLTLWAPVAGFSKSIEKQIKRKSIDIVIENPPQTGPEQQQQPLPLNLQRHAQMEQAQKEEEVEQQALVMKQYRALRELSELISEANGETILPFISEAVFGYALFFEDVLITTNIFQTIVLVCFYFCAVNILVFSADVCRKMKCMKAWLWDKDRFSSFPSQKLQLILHDLSTNAVGITASGIFTIDFYLVGSMISVLITLFIIRLQYQT